MVPRYCYSHLQPQDRLLDRLGRLLDRGQQLVLDRHVRSHSTALQVKTGLGKEAAVAVLQTPPLHRLQQKVQGRWALRLVVALVIRLVY